MQNRPLETFFMPIVVCTARDWFLSSQKMELNVLKNCSRIVQIWLLQIKVGMIELSSRLQIKEGNQLWYVTTRRSSDLKFVTSPLASDTSSSDDSDDSDSSEDSHYRRKRRKKKKQQKKDPIRLCATLTAKLLTTAYKSKIIRFKLDEDTLQRRIYFLTFIDSLNMIFSQYKETYEVLKDYPKMGGGM